MKVVKSGLKMLTEQSDAVWCCVVVVVVVVKDGNSTSG